MTDYLPIRAPNIHTAIPQGQGPEPDQVALINAKAAAQKLEATFLAEMLKAAGFGEQDNSFSGGHGEDQFASFHRMAIAEKIAATESFGLAEYFVKAMMDKQDD